MTVPTYEQEAARLRAHIEEILRHADTAFDSAIAADATFVAAHIRKVCAIARAALAVRLGQPNSNPPAGVAGVREGS